MCAEQFSAFQQLCWTFKQIWEYLHSFKDVIIAREFLNFFHVVKFHEKIRLPETANTKRCWKSDMIVLKKPSLVFMHINYLNKRWYLRQILQVCCSQCKCDWNWKPRPDILLNYEVTLNYSKTRCNLVVTCSMWLRANVLSNSLPMCN